MKSLGDFAKINLIKNYKKLISRYFITYFIILHFITYFIILHFIAFYITDTNVENVYLGNQ